MTDIGFDQIREGQTVRAHCLGGYSIEGPVIATGGYLVFGNAEGAREINPRVILRVELLSEPAPKWDVGQLAEIEYAIQGDDGPTRHTTAYWSGKGWDSIENGIGFLMPPEVIGEPRLLKAVPADAVVLPAMNEAEATTWRAAHFRTYAELALGWGAKHMAGSLQIIADAIEAVE